MLRSVALGVAAVLTCAAALTITLTAGHRHTARPPTPTASLNPGASEGDGMP